MQMTPSSIDHRQRSSSLSSSSPPSYTPFSSSPPSSSTLSRPRSPPASLPASHTMIKLWTSAPADQLTPRAGPNGQERANPFDSTAIQQQAPSAPQQHQPTAHLLSDPRQSQPLASPSLAAPRSPTVAGFQHHHLLNTRSVLSPSSVNGGDVTPLAGLTPPVLSSAAASDFAAALPHTNLSLHAPQFKMQRPPTHRSQPSNVSITSTLTTSSSGSPPSATSGPAASKGQIHVKLIQARGLNVTHSNARPYVVVQFEQNEFIGRDPIDEFEKEVKGMPTTLSRNSSSTALSALGAIASSKAFDFAKRAKPSANSTPRSSHSSSSKAGSTNGDATPTGTGPSYHGFFIGAAAHNPVWKHEVTFDVTVDSSVLTFSVYDRAVEDQGFLGRLEIKPVLLNDHTVDQWYKLRPYENEIVTGEMRVQITYEQFKTKRALTPRDFEFLKLIGRGTFGRVFQVRKKDTKRIYAMKVLSKKEIIAKKEVAHTIGERKILQQSLESPFLVGLKFSFQTDTDLYLVTDFKSGGELFWHLQKETKFTEDRARFYIAELVLALEHLHKYNIVYRDLKPENILLDATGHVALCDFGLSKPDLKPDQLTNTFCGTTEYLAPEVLLDDHGYSKLVDFWSLGVLLFEMCCGWSPFYAEDTQQMYKNICFGKIRFPKGVIGEDGKQFVKGLLNRNPKHRLGAMRDAAELKEHPFFKQIDWEALARKQVTPPFKPVVESDESVTNFDPEFTSADLRDAGIDFFDDEEDPSEEWLSHSLSNSAIHTPNGPLGSDLRDQQGRAIQIAQKKKKGDHKGSPLTNSVQENFKGFSYMGESVNYGMLAEAAEDADDDNESAVDDEETQEMNSEDEYFDERPGGRYKGKDHMDDDISME